MKIRTELRVLRGVATLNALILLGIGTLGLKSEKNVEGATGKFDVIDVKRINVREDDGNYSVVLANTNRTPGNVIAGKEHPGGERGAGLIFYDGKGNETGGLIFGASKS